MAGFFSGLADTWGKQLDDRQTAAALAPYLDSVYGAESGAPQKGGFLSQLLGMGQAPAGGVQVAQSPAVPGAATTATTAPLSTSPQRKGFTAAEINAAPQSNALISSLPTLPDVATASLPGADAMPAAAAGNAPRLPRAAIERLLANPETRRLGMMLIPGGELDREREGNAWDRSFSERKFAADQDYRRQSLDIQRQAGARADRQFTEGRVPTGYRATGSGYEAISGGPQDTNALIANRRMLAQEAGLQAGTPDYARFMMTGEMSATDSAPRTTTMYDPETGQPQTAQWDSGSRNWTPIGGVKQALARPVPAAIQKAEAEDLQDVQTIGQLNSQLGGFIDQIDNGKLVLGPVQNRISELKNYADNSDENSRNYASFVAGMEKMRNESLRLNKGVQTEGDAQRAWNEVLANINDPAVVKQRLQEIQRYNATAAEFKKNLVGLRRATSNLPELDIDTVVTAPATGGPKSGVSSSPREGQTATNPQTGERIIFRNGQWGRL